jgi:tetratricopeptide (TPR) repeat protein
MRSRERRLLVLTSVLIAALGLLLYRSAVVPALERARAEADRAAQLSVPNELFAAVVTKVTPTWVHLDIDLHYNGVVGTDARLTVELPEADKAKDKFINVQVPLHVRNIGRQTIQVGLWRESSGNFEVKRLATSQVQARLTAVNGAVLAERTFDLPIIWPSNDPFQLVSGDAADLQRIYTLCVETIDSGSNLEHAKRGLETILLADPRFVPAYAELARYHMKTNWNDEGRKQAEQALLAALRIEPEHANSLVLLGYVQANQRRFMEAEETMRHAESIGTPNIWLYTNRAQMYVMQGSKKKAIAEYRRAIDAPKDLQTYERARARAYDDLLPLLVADHEIEQADELFRRRLTQFPDNACYAADYASFLLGEQGSIDEAVANATIALEHGCEEQARHVLSLAYLGRWARALDSGGAAGDAEADFNRAFALNADAPELVYGLASASNMNAVLRRLGQRGITIDTPDGDGWTALSYAIGRSDLDAGKVLIAQGADVNRELNPDGFTPLMFAAARGNQSFVELLLKHGADRRARTKSGIDAETIATQQGFHVIGALVKARTTGT